jgi:ribonuclease D
LGSPKLKSPAKWIDTAGSLDNLIKVLKHETVIAVDTESDSLYSYFEKVCLIQFSTTDADYLLDPLNVDISGLAAFFANRSIQKIFHAAEYDFLSLKRDYGFSFANLFDTMLAARILGWARYGLASLLKEHFGVNLDKRFQRYNWGRRPLSEEALNYAHLDTHFLIALRDIQLKELEQENRLREATEAFGRVTQVEPTPKVFNPDDFWRIKSCKDLTPPQQAIVKELFIFRDRLARKLDRPPFKVMNDSVLVELAKSPPSGQADLFQTKGLGNKVVAYNGEGILKAIEEGQAARPPQQPPNNHRPDDNILARYEVLRQWRNNLAAERGVEPDVIISNQALMDIARRNPHNLRTLSKMDILGEWQRETYGKALLEVLDTS